MSAVEVVPTPAQTLAVLVAKCKRQTRTQSRTRIASLLAYRLVEPLLDAIDTGDFDRARALLSGYWRYLGDARNARLAAQSSELAFTKMASGYRAHLGRKDGTTFCVLSRARRYERWLARLRPTVCAR
jgi:hypothetical protein